MPGRSLPFDQLLAAFNATNHASAARPPSLPGAHPAHAFAGKGGAGALRTA